MCIIKMLSVFIYNLSDWIYKSINQSVSKQNGTLIEKCYYLMSIYKFSNWIKFATHIWIQSESLSKWISQSQQNNRARIELLC